MPATLALASALVLALSVRFLTQPFVWRNWPLDEILYGWLLILRDRAIVALAIVMAIGGGRRTLRAVRPAAARALLFALFVLTGAICGEVLQRSLRGEQLGSVVLAQSLHWGVVVFAIAITYYAWRRSVDAREHLRRQHLRRARIESQLADTRITALTTQIEPHFLFNTLATVRRLQHTERETGERVLASLIAHLQLTAGMLGCLQVPLAQELALVRAYLDIIATRMRGRLRVAVEVQESLAHALVPPLSLATLVENAVKHGVTPAPGPVEIHVRVGCIGERMELSVTDTGVGLGTETNAGSGIGLHNLRERLVTQHGAAASLLVTQNPGRGVRATIMLPCRACAT